MRKLFTLCIATLSLTVILAQGPQVYIVGTVHNPDVNIAGIEVFITAQFSDSSMYFNTVMTDADGHFSDVFEPPASETAGTVHVSLIDCDGNVLSQTRTWGNGIATLSFDFQYCAVTETGDTCGVVIVQEGDPVTNVAALYAVPLEGVATSYLWNTGETTEYIIPNAFGTYCVTISTASGCTATGCFVYVGDSSNCQVMINPSPNAIPALVAIGYGVPPFTYSWSTGETGETISPPGPGNYCVTLTDATGCEASACYAIDSTSCEAWISCDAQGVLTAGGYGTPPYEYSWNTGDASPTIVPVAAGLYCVTITDQLGCTASSCYYYSPPEECSVVLTYDAGPTDSPGIVVATPIGTPPFTYQWSTGETTEFIELDTFTTGICLTVTDANGCTVTTCLDSLFNNCAAWIGVTYTNAGTAELTAYGNNAGTVNGNFLFAWSNGETSQTITVTEPGEYCVAVTNLLTGCSATSCVTVTFNNLSDSCDAVVISQGATGANAFILEVVAFGVPPFTYQWSNGEIGPVITVLDPNVDYCVTVTDATGCVTEACAAELPPCNVWIDVQLADSATWVLSAMSSPPNLALDYIWNTGAIGTVITTTETGLYCVTATPVDPVDSCYASACVVIDADGPDTTGAGTPINGYVLGGGDVTGVVELYAMTSANAGITNAWTLVDSTGISADNYYSFDHVPPGVYAVRAIPDPGTNGEQEFFPTYHVSAIDWQQADPVFHPSPLTVTTDIHLVPTTNVQGTGVISGTIVDPDGLLPDITEDVRSSGVPGVEVILSTSDRTPIAYTFSDISGGFVFEGLPFGAYVLTFEVAGLSSPELWVTITEENQSIAGLELNTGNPLPSSPQDLLPVATDLVIYPQPAVDRMMLQLNVDEPTEYDVQILTLNGALVDRQRFTLSSENPRALDVSGLSPGMYVLRLLAHNGQIAKKWIKI